MVDMIVRYCLLMFQGLWDFTVVAFQKLW